MKKLDPPPIQLIWWLSNAQNNRRLCLRWLFFRSGYIYEPLDNVTSKVFVVRLDRD